MSELHEKLRRLQEPDQLSHRVTIYGDGSGTLEREVWPIPDVGDDDYEVVKHFDSEAEMNGYIDLLLNDDPLDILIAMQEKVLADLKERKRERDV